MSSRLTLSLSFIDYILSSGDYNDPETRLPLSEETLERLDIFGMRLGKRSVREARAELMDSLEHQKHVRDELTGLENIAGDCVSQMYDYIEAVNEKRETQDEATVQLLTQVFPIFEQAFQQILATDPETARICATQFENFLKGPPRNPTKDRNGFLKLVLGLFHSACGQHSVTF